MEYKYKIRGIHFTQRLGNGDIGLFYYSGHGLQVKNRNFLVPIGAKIRNQTDIKRKTVDVNRVLKNYSRAVTPSYNILSS